MDQGLSEGCSYPKEGKMSDIKVGINLEYVRHADRSFEYGLRKAAEIGYKYVEPCVLNGRDLLAEAGYYHFKSMDDDPLEVKGMMEDLGLKPSGLSAHSQLMKPERAIPYLTRAIRWASDLGAPVVNTDEGTPYSWMSEEDCWEIMRYTLRVVIPWAERYGIFVAIEPHGKYTTKLDTLLRILELVDSPYLKINFDTGNTYLAGEDPIEFLSAIVDRVVHIHAKDIGGVLLEERGKVTGTPVGVACGDGVIDWPAVVRILKKAGYKGVLSVECGTEEQAVRSLEYLNKVIAEA